MTEEEAKTKWCPLAMNNACTRDPTGIPPGAHCVASDCACWVWDIGLYSNKTEKFLEAGEFYSSTDIVIKMERKDRGHCGLIST